MNEEQERVLREIKYKMSVALLTKMLKNGVITEEEFNKTNIFLNRRYKVDYSSIWLAFEKNV